MILNVNYCSLLHVVAKRTFPSKLKHIITLNGKKSVNKPYKIEVCPSQTWKMLSKSKSGGFTPGEGGIFTTLLLHQNYPENGNHLAFSGNATIQWPHTVVEGKSLRFASIRRWNTPPLIPLCDLKIHRNWPKRPIFHLLHQISWPPGGRL